MSATSEWVYTNVATVWPVGAFDDWTGKQTYGAPYLIACTWEANKEIAIDDTGKEFTTNLIFFTESKYQGAFVRQPARDDYIQKGDSSAQVDPLTAGADKVKAVKEWDMSFFAEDPDYKVMT